MTKNQNVLKWVEEMKALTQPDKVVWIDGSEEQLKALRDEAIATGEMIELNQEKLPGCLYHRTAENDVARVEDRTFICSREKENAGPTNNWMDPKEMYAKLTKLYDGVMKGRTMYVIPYSMGPIGSPIAKVGVELTDSIYVVLNMDIMTRMGAQAFKNLPDDSNDFVRCLHSKADVDPEKRYIVRFPEDNTIWSINSVYGGNVLLGKKCFALRIASYQGWKEGWMAEHMLILGVKKPDGDIKYITAATVQPMPDPVRRVGLNYCNFKGEQPNADTGQDLPRQIRTEKSRPQDRTDRCAPALPRHRPLLEDRKPADDRQLQGPRCLL